MLSIPHMEYASGQQIASLFIVALALFSSACGVIDADINTEELESGPPPVPTYEEQQTEGVIDGRPWQVASARVRRPMGSDGEGADELIVELYGQTHEDLCSGLTPERPRPSRGEGLVEIRDLPAEVGEYELATEMNPREAAEGRPELSFMKRKDERSWGGVPYARGWVEILEVTDSRVRGRLAAVSQTGDDYEATGWFVAERCGCVNCR